MFSSHTRIILSHVISCLGYQLVISLVPTISLRSIHVTIDARVKLVHQVGVVRTYRMKSVLYPRDVGEKAVVNIPAVLFASPDPGVADDP